MHPAGSATYNAPGGRQSSCFSSMTIGCNRLRSSEASRTVYAKVFTNGDCPFIYLSLDINPSSLVVNVYPRKLKVTLLNQNKTVAEICKEIYDQLVASQYDYRGPAISPTPDNFYQFSWGLVLDSTLLAPISTPTADRGTQG